MRKILITTALLLGVLLGSVGIAFAAFDNSPPTPAGWMTRPCKDSADDQTILTQNCYWTTGMGTWTDANGNPVTVGFWIRKMPNQPLICYFYSPDQQLQTSHDDTCYTTTANKTVFLHRTFYRHER